MAIACLGLTPARRSVAMFLPRLPRMVLAVRPCFRGMTSSLRLRAAKLRRKQSFEMMGEPHRQALLDRRLECARNRAAHHFLRHRRPPELDDGKSRLSGAAEDL